MTSPALTARNRARTPLRFAGASFSGRARGRREYQTVQVADVRLAVQDRDGVGVLRGVVAPISKQPRCGVSMMTPRPRPGPRAPRPRRCSGRARSAAASAWLRNQSGMNSTACFPVSRILCSRSTRRYSASSAHTPLAQVLAQAAGKARGRVVHDPASAAPAAWYQPRGRRASTSLPLNLYLKVIRTRLRTKFPTPSLTLF